MIISRRCNDRGFTLFEVILVLVLISIFAAVAVTRQPDTDSSLRAHSDILRAHIRYAQMRAMNTDAIWGIGIDAGGAGYWLFRDQNDAANRRRLPGQDETMVNLGAKGISISSTAAAVSFDSWGRPMADTLLLTAPLLPVSLSKSGQSHSVNITRNTGFIP